jgi:hypothetical protein
MEDHMKSATTTSPNRIETRAGSPNEPLLFSNLLKTPSLAEDAAGAFVVLLATIPVTLFLLLALGSPPPACTEAEASPKAASPSHAEQALVAR